MQGHYYMLPLPHAGKICRRTCRFRIQHSEPRQITILEISAFRLVHGQCNYLIHWRLIMEDSSKSHTQSSARIRSFTDSVLLHQCGDSQYKWNWRSCNNCQLPWRYMWYCDSLVPWRFRRLSVPACTKKLWRWCSVKAGGCLQLWPTGWLMREPTCIWSRAHVTRAVEVYNERFISYSLGNFCTYGRFNLQDQTELHLWWSLMSHWRQVHIRKNNPGIPDKRRGGRIDPEGRVIRKIKDLVELDFPESVITISDNGDISYK